MRFDCYIEKPINTPYGRRCKERDPHNIGLMKYIETPQPYIIESGKCIKLDVYEGGEYFADMICAAYERCEGTPVQACVVFDGRLAQAMPNCCYMNVDATNPGNKFKIYGRMRDGSPVPKKVG